MLHKCVWRQHNETHQTLFETQVEREWEYIRGSELAQGAQVWNYLNEIPSYF
jgi:hypothetical protein